jgi:hypothetical protein
MAMGHHSPTVTSLVYARYTHSNMRSIFDRFYVKPEVLATN